MDLLSDSLFARIDKRILRLADDPRPQGCRKLRGQKDIWRIRIGDYRVIYGVNDTTRTVSILRIAHRREVYG
jgi:mRNA interferase RelE/StbE